MTTNDRRIQVLTFIGLASTLLLWSLPAMSECDAGGISGSGLHDSIITGTGAGGTGLHAAETTGTGTGGTGLEANRDRGTGTGGTGIFGVVTGFGSVCVNGFEVEYNGETKIRQDGASASVSSLAVGQTVRISTAAARPSFATHIDVESSLAGPVGRIDASRRRVWIMDQAVELRTSAIVFDRTTGKPMTLDQLRPGSHLSVSGLRRADGILSASRIEKQPAGEQAIVTAVMQELGRGTAYVGDTRVSLSGIDPSADSTGSADRASGPSREGRRLRVRGRWNEKSRTLEATRLDDAAVFAPQARRVSIQGFAAPSRTDADFRLAGTSLEIRHDAKELPELNVDALVRIEGRIDDQGRLQSDRVIVDIPGRHGHPLRSSGRGIEHGKGEEDRSGRSGRQEREGRSDREGREERGDRSGRRGGGSLDQVESVGQISSEGIEAESAVPDRVDRPDRGERGERNERPERPDRSERSRRSRN